MARVLLVLACLWPVVSRADPLAITWTQTQPFSFADNIQTISRSEGGGWFQRLRGVYQPGVLDFAGALPGFQLGDQHYALTAVEATLKSTYSNVVQFAAYDCCVMVDTKFAGTFEAVIETRFSFQPFGTPTAAQKWSDWLYDECWTSCHTLATYPLTTTVDLRWAWLDTSPFTRSGKLQLELSKTAAMEMTAWLDDDTWSELRNPTNKWSGSVTLQYVYQAQPVPEAPTLGMFVPGLLAVALIAARRRPAAGR